MILLGYSHVSRFTFMDGEKWVNALSPIAAVCHHFFFSLFISQLFRQIPRDGRVGRFYGWS
jgi:hypothetical protein